MSLDFAIRDDDGKPRVAIHLDEDTHFEFIEAAKQANLAISRLFSEFYEDASVETHQLAELQTELKVLLSKKIDANTRFFVEKLLDLVELALTKDKPIIAVAD